MRTGSAMTMAIAVAWALLWAAAFAATKVALRDAPAELVVGVRCELAGLLLIAARLRHLRHVGMHRLAGLAVLGLLNNTGYLGVMGLALHHLSAGMAAILSSCTPLLVLLASAALGMRRLTFVHLLGVALAFGGVTLSALDRMDGTGIAPAGVAWGAVSVLCLAAGTLLTPRLAADTDIYAATGWQAAIGGLPLLALTAILQPAVHPSGRLLATTLFLSLGASVIGMSLWLLLIRRAGPGQASIAQFLPPVFGVGIGAVFLAEPLTVREAVAVAPIAAGILLATRIPRKPGPKDPRESRREDRPLRQRG
ncbi:drug/metabolite transporter (DMT)-like permease [Streptomyces sp. V4I23]|uniref:DMT family transporter n=1 Tax=Streptomyces sp. V4I23 TaxID=3042282 RepID=UPI002788D161|nr:DMT family transporter [Streptomyces sp. V4I23]MDQ1013321.1 drug/metabolite transporter (DMT)-like permease [Streptomyces sp. V4I23]